MKILFKAITLTTIIALSACTNAPSPQDTSPEKPAKCNAIRAQMMRAGHQNNTSNAILDTEQQGLQETYKNECE